MGNCKSCPGIYSDKNIESNIDRDKLVVDFEEKENDPDIKFNIMHKESIEVIIFLISKSSIKKNLILNEISKSPRMSKANIFPSPKRESIQTITVNNSVNSGKKRPIIVKSIMNIDLGEEDYTFIRETLLKQFLIKNLEGSIMYSIINLTERKY